MTLDETIASLGLTVESVFVPWSHSRSFVKDATVNKRNLNWRVTLWCGMKQILTTDYSVGIAHCPSYKAHNARWTIDYAAAIEYETERGHTARGLSSYVSKGKAILPKAHDVIHALVLDSSVLNYVSFESWARDFDYDPDSRKGEATYNACLATALAMRNGIGEAGMATLREAFQDY